MRDETEKVTIGEHSNYSVYKGSGLSPARNRYNLVRRKKASWVPIRTTLSDMRNAEELT